MKDLWGTAKRCVGQNRTALSESVLAVVGYLRPALNGFHQKESGQFADRIQKNKMVTLNFNSRCTYQLRLQIARFEPYHKGHIWHTLSRPFQVDSKARN